MKGFPGHPYQILCLICFWTHPFLIFTPASTRLVAEGRKVQNIWPSSFVIDEIDDAEIVSQNDRPEGVPSIAAKDLERVNEEWKKRRSPVWCLPQSLRW